MSVPLVLRDGPCAPILAAARRRPDTCAVHGYHWPPPLGLHVHHIQPLGMGGANVEWNRIAVCPSGHTNIHRIMGLIHRGEPLVGTRRERTVAATGYQMWFEAGQPGGRVTLGEALPEEFQ